MPPALNALLSTGQYASEFNQPLSFNTASVTTMEYMFYVRSTRSRPPPPSPPHLRLRSSPEPTRALNAVLLTWQFARAFNQTLNFDTSGVTTMGRMFSVRRSTRAPPLMIALRTLAGPLLAPPPAHTLAPPSPHAANL